MTKPASLADLASIVDANEIRPLVADTAKSATGTFVDFTGIPSWVKRVTVTFNGVSTNGTSNFLVQVGAGSITSSGYNSYAMNFGGGSGAGGAYTTGFGIRISGATRSASGVITLVNLSGNVWTQQHNLGDSVNTDGYFGGGVVALSGTLDRIRVTTVNGTDVFDAGTINILYE